MEGILYIFDIFWHKIYNPRFFRISLTIIFRTVVPYISIFMYRLGISDPKIWNLKCSQTWNFLTLQVENSTPDFQWQVAVRTLFHAHNYTITKHCINLPAGYETKCILCLDLGYIPMIFYYVYTSIPKSETIPNPKHFWVLIFVSKTILSHYYGSWEMRITIVIWL